MGGLIVQKLLERGLARAGVLITPASPADARGSRAMAQAVTFANVLFSGNVTGKSHKIWRFGFDWGVLNKVPRAKHDGIYAGAVYDSGGVYGDIAYPDRDPDRTAFIDETKITVPILTIGAAKDRATPVSDVQLAAEKYSRVGGDYLEYPDNAHWIIDEPGTDQVISDIDTWLKSKGLTPVARAKAKAAAPKAAPKAALAKTRVVARAKPKAPPKATVKTTTTVKKPSPAKVTPSVKAPAKAKTSVRKPKSP